MPSLRHGLQPRWRCPSGSIPGRRWRSRSSLIPGWLAEHPHTRRWLRWWTTNRSYQSATSPPSFPQFALKVLLPSPGSKGEGTSPTDQPRIPLGMWSSGPWKPCSTRQAKSRISTASVSSIGSSETLFFWCSLRGLRLAKTGAMPLERLYRLRGCPSSSWLQRLSMFGTGGRVLTLVWPTRTTWSEALIG